MSRRAMEGTSLAAMVRMALPICRAAERQRPRTGPGRTADDVDAVVAVLVTVAVLKKRMSKSAQYRFLTQHRRSLMRWLNLNRWPARSTYCRRHRRAHQLFTLAIELQGRQALAEGVGNAETVAVDKRLVTARGPRWHRSDRRRGRVPTHLRGVDCDSEWGFSRHDGWVQGNSYEVLVTAGAGGVVLPLLASADTAAGRRQDHRRRQQRIARYHSRRGQRQYARRGRTVEPLHEWFKDLIDLKDHVWHRGLDNNRTQLLAAILCYQLLLRYNHRRGRHNAQIRWILDTM